VVMACGPGQLPAVGPKVSALVLTVAIATADFRDALFNLLVSKGLELFSKRAEMTPR